MSALDSIEYGLRNLGYEAGTLRRGYAFADVLGPVAETRSVALAAFTRSPESFRSAAFGVVEGGDDGAATVMAHRALGAPIFFSIDENDIGVWAVAARESPRLLERVALDGLPALFDRNHDLWTPQALHRAKAAGSTRGPQQLDFVDLGLMPAIETEVRSKLDVTMSDVLGLLLVDASEPEEERVAFRLAFRLLAARILIDRAHPAAAGWDQGDVSTVLTGIETYYSLGRLQEGASSILGQRIAAAWHRLSRSITLRNISSDSLAFVYENTLVTADTRRLFGTHSTPQALADYVIGQIDLSRHDLDTMRVVEPFAGAGIFLVAALRALRDQLPPSWSDARRHSFLTCRVVGAEVDAFACEVATLSLILADYPNANGWLVSQADLFEPGALEAVIQGSTVVLCNPPFESFTKDERRAYPEAFSISHSKAIVAFSIALDAAPEALGFVLPRGILQQKQYKALRVRLAETYRAVELVSLPDRIFGKAAYPCALVIATERRGADDTTTDTRLISKTVADGARVTFLADGTIRDVRHEVRSSIRDGQLWIGALDVIWAYLHDAPKLGAHVDVYRGLKWWSQRAGVSGTPVPSHRLGVYRPIDSLKPFHLKDPVWLNSDPSMNMFPGPLGRPWSEPKVLINNQRSSRGPWRLVAAADRTGLWASQQFTGLWPTGAYGVDALAAILNGPVANAFVTEYATEQHFTNAMLKHLPLPPRLDHDALDDAVLDYQRTLTEYGAGLRPADHDAQLDQRLRWIDAVVLDGYDLPPRLERQLFRSFEGHTRPTRHAFSGWLPDDLKGCVPLYEWMTVDRRTVRAPWVLDVFRPVPDDENDAMARFLA